MASCVCLIPAAATNTPPKFRLSSIHDLGGGNSNVGGASTGRRLPGISSGTTATQSPSLRGKRCLLHGKSESTTTTGFRCKSQLVVDLAPATSVAYGALLLGGGLFAYTRTGSKGSLLGGLTGGSLMAAAYFLMQASEMKEIGDALAFGSAFLFASVFGIRLAATRKIIPAAPLLGLSICASAVFISAYLQDSL